MKCACTNCGGHIEFEDIDVGAETGCPHCEMATVLTDGIAEAPPKLVRPSIPRATIVKWVAVSCATVVGLGLLWAAGWAILNWYREIGNVVLALLMLAGACLLIVIVLLWILLPVFVYEYLRRITQSLERVERRSKP